MPIIEKNSVLKCDPNKIQLYQLFLNCISSDEEFLKEAPQTHRLVMAGNNTIPDRFFHGRKTPKLDLDYSLDEVDITITKHAILYD